MNSGTDAIKLSLKSLGVGYGDEVITAANTFVATVGAIIELGAKPVFVDCDDTFCMNVDDVKKYFKKTKAILPVHFTGYMTNMKKVMKISKNLKFQWLKMLANLYLVLTTEKMLDVGVSLEHFHFIL